MPKKKGGSLHNNRHENGVVAPGKRVTKQRSNGQLNGTVNLPSTANGSPSHPSTAARTTPPVPEKRPNGQPPDLKDGFPPTSLQHNDSKENSTVKPSASLPDHVGQANGTLCATSSNTDPAALSTSTARKDNVFNLAMTILRSCPLGDTLTILIILLSIPSTVLTLINTLFAMLTFMPPAGSFFSLPHTFNDIFQGSGGTPSLATIVITDVLGLILWLMAWTPVQALAIEYTQAVVAATLGGGNANKKTGYDSTLLCMAIVTLRHVSSRGWTPTRILGFDWSAILSKIPYVSDRPQSFIPVPTNDFLLSDPKSGWAWFRILIALHILIQGLVHVARRWYQKRDYFQSAPLSKKTDPEAGGTSSVRSLPNTVGEAGTHSGTGALSNATSKTLLIIAKDTRDKASSGKKKRKQATLVRSWQPLWAAFAATKVTILREYEQTHSLSDMSVANAKDPNDLGNASFEDSVDRVWISEVHSDSFTFYASYSSALPQTTDGGKAEASAGVDRTKPFYVRINDTDWTSTKIVRHNQADSTAAIWSGVVFGLTPSSSYRCSLVLSEDNEMVFSAIVTTSPSLMDDSETTSVSPEVSHGSHRLSSPTSPTTTLKKTIRTFQANLNDSLARQKRSKKDSKATGTAIKKDIDIFSTRINKLASEDRSHTNRHLQWNQHMKQADEAVISIEEEIEAFGNPPEDELNSCKEMKGSWEATKQAQQSTEGALARGREAAQREKNSVQNEAQSAQQKRERLFTRRAKLQDQYEKLESVTAEGLSHRERKNSEQAAKDLQRAQLDRDLQERVASFTQNWQDSQYSIGNAMSHAQLLENAFHEQQVIVSRPPNAEERPLTPEGDLPGEKPQKAASNTFRFPTFGTPESTGGLKGHSGSSSQAHARPRSTSHLSGNSNYVDFEDQDPAPPMPSRALDAIRGRDRNKSGGSAGGSSGSNSHPASPVVGHHVLDSPVGKRSPVWNQ